MRIIFIYMKQLFLTKRKTNINNFFSQIPLRKMFAFKQNDNYNTATEFWNNIYILIYANIIGPTSRRKHIFALAQCCTISSNNSYIHILGRINTSTLTYNTTDEKKTRTISFQSKRNVKSWLSFRAFWR